MSCLLAVLPQGACVFEVFCCLLTCVASSGVEVDIPLVGKTSQFRGANCFVGFFSDAPGGRVHLGLTVLSSRRVF